MTGADILLIALLFIATLVGLRLGLLRQTGMTIGLIGGLFAAAYIQWHFAQVASLSSGEASGRLYFWLLMLTLLLVVALFIDIGLSVGGWAHHKLEKFQRLEITDQIGGGALAAMTTIVAVWLCSALILRTPDPFFASQVRGSFVINSLKQTLPQPPDIFAHAGTLLDPFALPTVFAGAEPPAPASEPAPTLPASLQQTALAATPSVVRVAGKGCGGISAGTGFLVAENTVVTSAHVVAGMTSPFVVSQAGQHATQTILFDPRLDLAILHTTGLNATPLPLQVEPANNGDQGIRLGYATGRLLASGVTVLSRQKATGYDIYNRKPASRMVYTLSSSIEQGDSGGPVINEKGEVIGTVFAKSDTKPHIGYALTADQIDASVKLALEQNQTVPNGQCGRE